MATVWRSVILKGEFHRSTNKRHGSRTPANDTWWYCSSFKCVQKADQCISICITWSRRSMLYKSFYYESLWDNISCYTNELIYLNLILCCPVLSDLPEENRNLNAKLGGYYLINPWVARILCSVCHGVGVASCGFSPHRAAWRLKKSTLWQCENLATHILEHRDFRKEQLIFEV